MGVSSDSGVSREGYSGVSEFSGVSKIAQAVTPTPVAMFSTGEEGRLYLPFPQYLFRDAAATQPVTTDGQTVALMMDAANPIIARAATQSTVGAMPIYRTTGSKHWLDFTGNKWMRSTNTVNLSAVNESSMFIAVSGLTLTSFYPVCFELTADSTATSGAIIVNATPTGVIVYGHRGSGPRVTQSSVENAALGSNVISGRAKISTPIVTLRKNSVLIGSNTGSQGTGNLANDVLYIGARAGTSLYYNGLMYGLMLIGRLLTDADMLQNENYFAGLL